MARQRQARGPCCQRRQQDNKSTCLLAGVSRVDVERIWANLIRPPSRLSGAASAPLQDWVVLGSPRTWAPDLGAGGAENSGLESRVGPSCWAHVHSHRGEGVLLAEGGAVALKGSLWWCSWGGEPGAGLSLQVSVQNEIVLSLRQIVLVTLCAMPMPLCAHHVWQCPHKVSQRAGLASNHLSLL